jgi:hypothetical protein
MACGAGHKNVYSATRHWLRVHSTHKFACVCCKERHTYGYYPDLLRHTLNNMPELQELQELDDPHE